jgi:hypothetical protein
LLLVPAALAHWPTASLGKHTGAVLGHPKALKISPTVTWSPQSIRPSHYEHPLIAPRGTAPALVRQHPLCPEVPARCRWSPGILAPGLAITLALQWLCVRRFGRLAVVGGG